MKVYLKGFFWILLCFVYAGCKTDKKDSGVTGTFSEHPNIIIILADDMGYSDIEPFGGEIPTPNLEKLADSGFKMTQFYNAGRCCPTRASLLTGLYQHQARGLAVWTILLKMDRVKKFLHTKGI